MSARYKVSLTEDAERDLEEIYRYIAMSDSRESANRVLERLAEAIEALCELPERGSQPKELRELGNHGFRQVLFKPYRIFYRVLDRRVIISLIADGRRDMQTLLASRLLGS